MTKTRITTTDRATKIEVTNKFTGRVTIVEVPASRAWEALATEQRNWSCGSARFVA